MLGGSFFNSSVSFADSSLFKGSLSSDFTNNKRQLIASPTGGGAELVRRRGDSPNNLVNYYPLSAASRLEE